MDKINEVINKHWKEFRDYSNVLNIRKSTKFVKGKDTGKPCITFFVTRKLKSSKLTKEELIPKTVKGIITDVIELVAKDYTLGETDVSKLSPEQQKRMAGGVKK